MVLKWKPIEELWLRSQERFALGFRGSKTSFVDWVFFRVLDREFVNATPFTKSFNALAPRTGTSTFALFKDGDDEILDITENYADRLLYHAAIGVKPATDDLRIHQQFPSGQDLGDLLVLPPQEVGDDYGYVTALDSPFDSPTEALEYFVPYTFQVQLALANKERVAESAILPVFNIVMMEYLFEVLRPGVDKDTDLLINQMAHGRKKCRYKVMGPVRDPFQYLEGLSKHLDVDPISLEDARKLGGK